MLFISNFVLELINLNFNLMKKAVIVFIIAAMVLFTTGLWFFTNTKQFSPMALLQFGVIIMVVGFAIFFGFKRLGSAKRGEPTEDELSKKILQKGSSTAYYISIYLWLTIMYFSDRIKLETHSLIGGGILGMAIIFAMCWFFYYLRGIRNE
jgi:hypothetical protein